MFGYVFVQEFVEGFEFGVFYVWGFEDEVGCIFLVNEKVWLEVVGDGVLMFEEFIFKDFCVVVIQDIYLCENFDVWCIVFDEGELRLFIEVGVYFCGIFFFDVCEYVIDEFV